MADPGKDAVAVLTLLDCGACGECRACRLDMRRMDRAAGIRLPDIADASPEPPKRPAAGPTAPRAPRTAAPRATPRQGPRVKDRSRESERRAERAAERVLDAEGNLWHPSPYLQHGTSNGYNEYRCRCRTCKDFASERERARHKKRTAGLIVKDGHAFHPQPGLSHGTSNAYQYYGCRCEPCRKWSSEHAKQYREKRAQK